MFSLQTLSSVCVQFEIKIRCFSVETAENKSEKLFNNLFVSCIFNVQKSKELLPKVRRQKKSHTILAQVQMRSKFSVHVFFFFFICVERLSL